jgi:hypothetical protein
LTLVLGLLPIPQLRSLVLTTQTVLIQTVGDSLAFVESPLRAALIRGRILEGLERVKGRCERTVIVAHSQGAAATLDALGGILDHDETGESLAPPPEGPVPDALVTFGSGVNQLVSLKVLAGGRLERSTGTNAASAAVMAAMGMIALLVLLFFGVRSESTSIGQLVTTLALLVAFWGGSALVLVGAYQMLSKLTAWRVLGAWQEGADKKPKLRGMVVVLLVIYAAVLALVGYLFKDYLFFLGDLPFIHVVFLVLFLINLVVSMRTILSPATRIAVTRRVQYPTGLSRWMDVYASADPVPNGPTRIETTSAKVTSVQVWNRGALLSDHTTYWENLDGFVLRIVRMCAETAESPWQDKLPPATQAGWLDRRAAWRVGRLRCLVRSNRILWALILCLLWTRHEGSVPVPFGFPSWFWDWGPRAERFAILTALVVLAAWASAALLRWRWSVWVRAEQEAVLSHKPPGVVTFPKDALHGLGFVISLIATLAFAIAIGYESQASTLLVDQKYLFAAASFVIFVIYSGGVWISLIASWMFPGPQSPCLEGENVGPVGPHPSISS